MACDGLVPLLSLLFWSMPFLAYFWLRRRRKVAGASLTLGRLVITLWILTFPLMIASLFLGFTKLEGNRLGCGSVVTILAVLVAVYAAILHTMNARPKGGDVASNDV